MARVWVALDVPGASEAEQWMEALAPHRRFKVGLELFSAVGPGAVRRWAGRGYELFLDLKLHDIPRTVARATARLAGLGARLLTVHAAGGPAMLREAVAAAGSGLDIVGVTVLTSLDNATLAALGLPDAAAWADRLAGVAVEAGVPALVTSAWEAAALRARWPEVRLIVPGVRLSGDPAGDQARVATPAAAVEAGATDLVVGRSVLAAADPLRALHRIEEEAGHNA
jgi:orotidine-5'-phosphate decarboxylase